MKKRLISLKPSWFHLTIFFFLFLPGISLSETSEIYGKQQIQPTFQIDKPTEEQIERYLQLTHLP